jgi:hypothetical protein
MTPADFLNIVAAHNLRDIFDDPLTAADYPAFEIALDFLRRFADRGPLPSQGMIFRVSVSNLTTGVVLQTYNHARQWTGLTSAQLAKRAERFARMTGRQIDITTPVMAAAILALGIPQCDFSGGMIATFIDGHSVKDALDDLKACRAIMNAAPKPIVDEPLMLAKLALHGIDAPPNVIRLALAPRPDRIVAVTREPGSRWMRSVPLLTRPWSMKLGLEHLLDEFAEK